MNWKVDKRARRILTLLIFVMVQATGISFAQKNAAVEDAIFWEISGKGLKSPSYLFGTFHLLGNKYVDSLTVVMDKFHSSQVIAGELLIDSAQMLKEMMTASVLHGTTLDKILPTDAYQLTADWLKEISGYDLKMFNGMNPMVIQILIMSFLQQKYYPLDRAREMPMDLYFQKRGRTEGKKIVGLETIDVQVKALFGQFSYERQAEMLTEMVKSKDKSIAQMKELNILYRKGSLNRMEELMSGQVYNRQEAEIMLDNRNKQWMEAIPGLITDQSAFIAVGALHLSGENGLVSLLRKAGYVVTPLPLR